MGDNESALLNGEPVRIRECVKLSDSVLLTTDHLNVKKYRNISKFEKLIDELKIYRNWGDCYGYYLVATGYADVMIDPIMSVWDTMALIPVIKGAGGTITDYYGNDPLKGNSIIAAGKGIHSEIVKALS
jgi:fructose-1,6-bisphosphatase/inositol monophosphatase family enzyme